MPKFGIFNMDGDFMSVTSSSLEAIERAASNFSCDVQIGEYYMAESPWNPKKMTTHINLFKTITNSKRNGKRTVR